MSEFIQYKGKPIARSGNKIYCGNPVEKYILVLTIIECAGSVASRVIVQIWDTNPELALKNEKIVKETEKHDLFEALEIGVIWLDRELNKTV